MKTLKLMAMICMLGIANAATDNIPGFDPDVSKLTEALSNMTATDVGLSSDKLKKFNERISREITDKRFITEYDINPKNALLDMLRQIFINPKQVRQTQSETMELYFEVLYSAINEHAKKFSIQHGEHFTQGN